MIRTLCMVKRDAGFSINLVRVACNGMQTDDFIRRFEICEVVSMTCYEDGCAVVGVANFVIFV